MRHRFRYSFCRMLQNWVLAADLKKQHKNTLKTGKQQEKNQMTDDNCVASLPFLRRGD